MGFGRNLRGTGLAEFAAMADGPSNKGVLFLAAVVTLAALSVAARLNRMSPREIVAPEAWAALDRRESDRAAELFEQALRQRPARRGVCTSAWDRRNTREDGPRRRWRRCNAPSRSIPGSMTRWCCSDRWRTSVEKPSSRFDRCGRRPRFARATLM